MVKVIKNTGKSVCFLTPFLVLFSCSKKDIGTNINLAVTDSLLYIKHTKQTDLNEFLVEYYFDNTQKIEIADFGISIQKSSDLNDKRSLSIKKTPLNVTAGNYMIEGLMGDETYLLRLYTVAGKDTFFTTPKTLTAHNLQLVTNGEIIKFPRLFDFVATIVTNLPDTNAGIYSKLWIGDVECPVDWENGPFIHFKIPESIPYGYYNLKIQRKGLEAKIDSVYIQFGKFRDLGIYSDELSPGVNALRGDYGVFQMGNKGYLFGGNYLRETIMSPDGVMENVPRYFLEYDEGSWNKIYYSVPVNFKYPIVQTVNNEAFVLGGFFDTTFSNGSHIPLQNVYKFDLANRTWIEKAPLPWPLIRARAISFSIQDKIYVGLGEGGDFFTGAVEYTDIWEYNPQTDTWSRKSDFPGRPRSYASTFVINDKAYVIGGTILHDGHIVGDVTNELWEYTPSNDSWRKISYQNGPEPIFSACTFSYDNKGYILSGFKTTVSPGGYVNGPTINWQFDPKTETFLEITSNAGGKPIYQNGNKFVLVFPGLEGDPSQGGQRVYEFIPE
ncbi:MAG: hypothetical protein KIT80_09630 [Chitinophagaceae bacterium]|nr:hypothetical protein [Chitinophagaceae bacterium]MCW5927159.1 hypothetical protein [Chitinophagaceae bacterium]